MSWDRELEQGLPDCRLRGPGRRARTVVYRGQLFERVYCANCGADGGLVTAEWSPHIFYLCDRCARDDTALKSAEIPEALVRGGAVEQTK